jgi:hypothetical protein
MSCVRQSLGRPKKRRKQEHGEENAAEAQEARNHQAVNPRYLKLKSRCKFFINETSRASALHWDTLKPGGNQSMAKKTLKKAKKLEATKPLTVAVTGRFTPGR